LHQLKQFCAENWLEAFRAKSVVICLMAIYLQPNCIEKPVNMTHCKWWNSCIGIRHTPYLFWIWV